MKACAKTVIALALGVSVLVMLTGCQRGTGRPKTYSVTGTVTLNGQPVEGATVMFVPKNPGEGAQPATAETDAQGRYQLGTFAKGDGALPGEYLVRVVKFPKAQTSTGGATSEDEYRPPEETAAPPPPAPKNELPAKYADEKTSGLSFKVEPKSNTFNIELTP